MVQILLNLRSSAILKIENIDNLCILWSVLARLHPPENKYLNRVPKYRKYFNEPTNENFDHSKRFRCSDIHGFVRVIKTFIKTFELNFYQDKSNWKHILIPFEIGENDADKVIDLLICKNHYALIQKHYMYF